VRNLNVRDVLSGVFLLGLGSILAIHLGASLSMGSARNLGPGFFPFVTAIILAICGLVVLVGGLRRAGTDGPDIDWVGAFFICLGIVCFGLLLPRVGLLPALMVLLLVSTIFDRRFSMVQRVVYTIGMVVVAWLIFVVGLRVTVPLYTLPW